MVIKRIVFNLSSILDREGEGVVDWSSSVAIEDDSVDGREVKIRISAVDKLHKVVLFCNEEYIIWNAVEWNFEGRPCPSPHRCVDSGDVFRIDVDVIVGIEVIVTKTSRIDARDKFILRLPKPEEVHAEICVCDGKGGDYEWSWESGEKPRYGWWLREGDGEIWDDPDTSEVQIRDEVEYGCVIFFLEHDNAYVPVDEKCDGIGAALSDIHETDREFKTRKTDSLDILKCGVCFKNAVVGVRDVCVIAKICHVLCVDAIKVQKLRF